MAEQKNYRGKLVRKYCFQRYYQSNSSLYTTLCAVLLVEVLQEGKPVRMKFCADDELYSFASVNSGPMASIGLSEVGDEIVLKAEEEKNSLFIKSFYNVTMELGNKKLLEI